MTYSDLKTLLEGMTPEQLAMDVIVCAEEPGRGGPVDHPWTAEEDQVNPSGDGMEPISTYQPGGCGYEEGMEIDDEPIVARKGQVLLMLEDSRRRAQRGEAVADFLSDIEDLVPQAQRVLQGT